MFTFPWKIEKMVNFAHCFFFLSLTYKVLFYYFTYFFLYIFSHLISCLSLIFLTSYITLKKVMRYAISGFSNNIRDMWQHTGLKVLNLQWLMNQKKLLPPNKRMSWRTVMMDYLHWKPIQTDSDLSSCKPMKIQSLIQIQMIESYS